jgi:predicted membrane protein
VTVFGDVDLDLAAAVPTSRAKLDGVTIFGDVDVFVPASWEVTSAGTTILGDVRIDERVPVPGDGTVHRRCGSTW